MRIREFGSGTAVVLLHGAPTAPEHLDPLAHRLAESHRVLVPDLPGYGQTAAFVPYDMARVHALLEDALTECGANDVVTVGFSGGTIHALALATRGKLRVRGVVALAGGGDFSSDEKAKMLPSIVALRAGVDLRHVVPDLMLSPEPARRTPENIAEVISWVDATSAENLANELEAHVTASSILPAVRALGIPIVVRVGELDKAVPWAQCSRLLEACTRGIAEKVPGVGHALLLEDFEATLASIRRLLAAC